MDKALFTYNNEEEIGSYSLDHQYGILNEEFISALDSNNFYKTITEMKDNDPYIGALLCAIKNLIKQVTWSVKPATEDKVDVENAEFVESCLYDMQYTWRNTLDDILTMLEYGYSPFELVYKVRKGRDVKDKSKKSKYTDSKIGWAKLGHRSQDSLDRWEFDTNNNLLGMWQIIKPNYTRVFIPIEKMVIFSTCKYKNNPQGKSIIRNAYKSYYNKKEIERIECIGIERDLTGMPVALLPLEWLSSSADSNQKRFVSEAKTMVKRLRRNENEGIVFPSEYDTEGKRTGFELKLLSSAGRRQFDTNQIINRYNLAMLTTMLADFIMLGHNKVGSYSLSSDKTELFALSVGTFMDNICETLNKDGIETLCYLNALNTDNGYPELTHGDIERQELDKLGNYINSLTSSNIDLTDLETQNKLRDAAELPQITQEQYDENKINGDVKQDVNREVKNQESKPI